jgi:hypothetical protein
MKHMLVREFCIPTDQAETPTCTAIEATMPARQRTAPSISNYLIMPGYNDAYYPLSTQQRPMNMVVLRESIDEALAGFRCGPVRER